LGTDILQEGVGLADARAGDVEVMHVPVGFHQLRG
jgi:hypothetical protein